MTLRVFLHRRRLGRFCNRLLISFLILCMGDMNQQSVLALPARLLPALQLSPDWAATQDKGLGAGHRNPGDPEVGWFLGRSSGPWLRGFGYESLNRWKVSPSRPFLLAQAGAANGDAPASDGCFDLSARAKPGKTQLIWPGIQGARSYQVFRGLDGERIDFFLIGEVPGNQFAFLDGRAPNELTGLYFIRAVGAGIACDSDVASAHPTTARRPENYPPVIFSIPPTEASAGAQYAYPLRATDPNSDPIGYALVAGPEGMVVDPLSGRVEWLARPGEHTVVLSAMDPHGASDVQAFRVLVVAENAAPIANAGTDQTAFVAQVVTLDGSKSSDVDGNNLTFTWSFLSRPAGSGAALSDLHAVKPTFTVDVPGTYTAQLIVNDGTVDSAPDTVSITTENSAPVSNAGADQTAFVAQVVTLDGSKSSDVDGNNLTFTWSFLSRPAGSGAALSDLHAVKPTFTVDVPGTYTAQLIVNDGTVDSAPDTVSITTLNSAPVANAGTDQTAFVTQVVTLDGSQSSDVDGNNLTFTWSFVSRPAGSGAALSDLHAVKPTFTVDVPGTYTAQLIVNDGIVDSAPDTVTLTTLNSAPVANAGTDQTAFVAQVVTLDGSKSSDVDGNALTFTWSFASRPAGSGAALSDLHSVKPTFTVDVPGTYTAQLIVNDGTVDSAPDTVTLTTLNSAPVANAGTDQTAFVTQVVTLDGSKSSDVDGNALTFTWSFASRPAGSGAALSDLHAVKPTFTVDVPGTYTAQLIVNDGTVDSAPDTVTLTTGNTAPVANAGTDQTAFVAQVVTLDGSKSSDVDGNALTFTWSFASRPAGSGATLSDLHAVKPTFTVDVPGTYTAQLIVNDGTVDSAPDTVTLTTDNTAPVANAGTDQTAFVTQVVTLDGSKSSDVDGNGLSFTWSFVSRPAGSGAALSDLHAVKPTFTVDVPGTYTAQLIVNDGTVDSAPDTVTITTLNSAPVAHAGTDQTAFVTQVVTLDGSQSSDVDGNGLSFTWSFVSRPAGSGAVLSDLHAVKPTFTVDVPGTYAVQLIVNDGTVDSAPDTVTITTLNSAPVAHAGTDQTAFVTQVVTLDGSKSSDVDGNGLTFTWSFVSRPAGSGAALSDLHAVKPTFTVDVPGTYTAQLIVNDGTVDSAPDTVTITTLNSAPVAHAGTDQTAFVTQVVTLDGSQSSDVDGNGLSFTWSFVSRPAGSGAALSDLHAVKPTFTVDVPGTYTVQLIVNDGTVDSAPDSINISTLNSRPVAKAGVDQSVTAGDSVQLDGSGSSDVDNDPLTFQWSIIAKPQGSSASLSDPAVPKPTFNADLPGLYVVQLIVRDGQQDSDPDSASVTAVVRTVVVPDVVGLAQGSAETALLNAGLTVGPITSVSHATVPAGRVISQDPGAGSTVNAGAPIGLVLSTGPALVPVPNVLGLTQVAAGSAIQAATLTVGAVTSANHPTIPAGLVISQTPAAGSLVLPGASVALVISLGAGIPVLASIEVTPANLSVPRGATQQYAALGRWTDNHTEDLTAQVVWNSTQAGVASVNSLGFATALDPGQTVVEATKDGIKGIASLTVLAPALASIVVLPAKPTILVGQTVAFSAVGVLTDGTSQSLDGLVTWSSSAPLVAGISVAGVSIGASDGVTTIKAAKDGVEASTLLTVKAVVADAVPPTVTITAPAEGATLTALTDILGTANDVNFLKYVLEYAAAGETTFTSLTEGTSPVIGGVLGRFDPTVLMNDQYTVRLTVFDRGGNQTSVSRTYQVARDQKVGIFTVAYEDLNVPVAGLPIVLTRVYDSRDKRVGDFGFGWRLDIQTLQLRVNGIHGAGWRQDKSGGFLPTYSLAPTASHKVSLTLPDGKVEEFDMTPRPASQQIIPLEFVTAGYTARPGTLGRIEPLGSTDLIVVPASPGPTELLDFDNLTPYDPASFRYFSPEGQQFTLNKTAGVQSVRDPNGNTLTIGPNGITHSSGVGITMVRDAKGRITKITDPMGHSQTYAYDANGDLVSHTDPTANLTRFLYNRTHGLIEIRDPSGLRPVRNEYDNDGRLVANIDSEGNRIEYTHNVGTRQEIVRDRRGATTVFDYDDRGYVLSRVDALGNTTAFTYDAAGNLLTETDPLGHARTFTYDAQKNPLTVKDALGNTMTFVYNAQNRLLTTTDPLGRVVVNTYDANGNRTSTKDPLGNVVSYSYDASGNLKSITNPLGQTSSAEYDGKGRVTKQFDALGNSTTFSYDANGNLLTQTETRRDENGQLVNLVHENVYDAKNRIVKRVLPDGGFVQNEYDSRGKLLATVDRNGNRTTYAYNSAGKLIRMTYPDGTSESSTFDVEGSRLSSTDRAGRTTRYEYDLLRRLTRTVLPDGATLQNEYDAAGRLTASIDESGRRTTIEYDAAGRRTRVTDALGQVSTFGYDARGNQVSATDAAGRVTTFQYDAGDNRIKTTYADGSFTQVTYDAARRKVAQSDQAGHTTQFQYDALGRLIRVTDALGNATAYTYDELGNRVSQTDAAGRVTRWVYDNGGRVIRHTLPLGMSQTFTYDVAGNVVTRTDYSGRTTQFHYDSNNRMVEKVYPDGSQVHFTYTATGRPETTTDARGVTQYSYDARDRLVGVMNPGGLGVTYTYDTHGNRTSVTTATGTTAYGNDVLYRPVTVTDAGGGISTYTYDAAGNRRSVTRPNGVVTEYTYDALNRLTLLLNRKSDGTVLSSYAYTLGAVGNRTKVVEATGRMVEYQYDALLRLTQEKITDPVLGNRTIDYTYDSVGNRLTMTEGGGTTTYTYDLNDRLLSSGGTTQTYDVNGNLATRVTGGVMTTYTYDFDNRLVQASAAGSLVEYEYDTDGIRTSAVLNGARTDYLVDKNTAFAQVLEERNGAGVVQVRYVYGDDLISQVQGGTSRYYVYDGQGSTRQLTDSAQSVTDAYVFDAFGVSLGRTGTTANNYLYNGQQLDPNVGFYYLRARYYDAGTGRFTSIDPLGGSVFDPPSLHRYAYARNSPVDGSDPSGMFSLVSVSISIAIVGILSSIALGVYWAKKVFDYLPADAFQSLPDAALFGYVLGYAPSQHLAKTGNILAAGLAAALSMDSVVGGVDVLVPFKSPPQAWIYGYVGASVAFPPPTSSVALSGYVGGVWNVSQPGDYTGDFYSLSGSYVPARLKGRIPPNVSIFSGPPSGGATAGSYGLSVTLGTKGGFSSGISVGRTYYFDPYVIQAPPLPAIPRFSAPSFSSGVLLPSWQDIVQPLIPPGVPIPMF